MIGRTIGHYEIIEKIGEGGMGAVYKARDIRLDRSVALKMLPGEWVANAERKRRFALEAKAASALNHPNIITIYDIDVADGVDFIAMEYVAGHTLADMIPPDGMEPARAIQFGAQIADALATAHQSGIVHRDLKPSNIMVNEQGRVKVLDFGLAKLIEPVSGEGAATRTVRLKPATGTILGTVSYMAPEQAEGKPVDQRADIFSFGAVLYEMLSGVQPFRRDSVLGTLAAIVRDEPPALDAARIPPAVRQVVKRALEKNPEARYASGAELASALASRVACGGASRRSEPAVAGCGRRGGGCGCRPRWMEALQTEPGRLGSSRGPAGNRAAAGGRQGTCGVRSCTAGRGAHPGRPRLSAGLGGSRPKAAGTDRSRGGRGLHPRVGGREEALALRGHLADQGCAAAAWLLPVESRQTRFRRDNRGGPHLVVSGELAAGAGG